MALDTKVREELARERTALANERTLLSYARTVLGIIAVALFVFKFAPPGFNIGVGVSILCAAVFVWFWGYRRYKLVSHKIGYTEPSEPAEPEAELVAEETN